MSIMAQLVISNIKAPIWKDTSYSGPGFNDDIQFTGYHELKIRNYPEMNQFHIAVLHEVNISNLMSIQNFPRRPGVETQCT